MCFAEVDKNPPVRRNTQKQHLQNSDPNFTKKAQGKSILLKILPNSCLKTRLIDETPCKNVDSWSHPINSIIHAMHFQNNQNDTLRCMIFNIWRKAPRKVVQTIMKLRGPLFAWIEEADQNPQSTCRDDPEEAQMAHIDLTQLQRVHTRASSKIKRLGRSVSQRRMLRETEERPLTMIDEKPTDGQVPVRKIKTDMEWWSLRIF